MLFRSDSHLYELLRASESVGRELTNQFYALYADIRQRVLTRLCRENATIAPQEILRCIQKLLDRVLFCAFCEDRGLLPAESLKHAFEYPKVGGARTYLWPVRPAGHRSLSGPQ